MIAESVMHPVANRVNPARPRSFRRGLGLEKRIVILVVLRAHVLADLPFRMQLEHACKQKSRRRRSREDFLAKTAKSAKSAKEDKIVWKTGGADGPPTQRD